MKADTKEAIVTIKKYLLQAVTNFNATHGTDPHALGRIQILSGALSALVQLGELEGKEPPVDKFRRGPGVVFDPTRKPDDPHDF